MILKENNPQPFVVFHFEIGLKTGKCKILQNLKNCTFPPTEKWYSPINFTDLLL